jgi:hypothetical protein
MPFLHKVVLPIIIIIIHGYSINDSQHFAKLLPKLCHIWRMSMWLYHKIPGYHIEEMGVNKVGSKIAVEK